LSPRLNPTATWIEEAGGQGMTIPLNVTDEAAIEALFDEVRRLWGVETLVNNAGVNPFLGDAGRLGVKYIKNRNSIREQ
jgi:short chain dehydrogenase.